MVAPETHDVYIVDIINTLRSRSGRAVAGQPGPNGGAARPDHDVQIRTVERGIARTHGSKEEGADALLATDMPKLVATLRGGPHDERDRALILLGFAGAFRASELVGLNIEQLNFSLHAAAGTTGGSSTMAGGVRVYVARSKEDQLGHGAFVDIPRGHSAATCPVRALESWLARVGRPCGPLFRVVHGTVVEHQRMHVGAVSRAVQRACLRAGMVGDYSAHSLRVGLATSARMAGAPIEAIQRHGRWQHRRSVERYFRLEPAYQTNNPAQGLL